MKIRLLTMDDYDSLYELWMSSEGMGLNSVDDSREGIERFLERNPRTCFAAVECDSGELIGAILAGSDGRRGYIYHTAVRRDKRGRGTGKALVDASLKALKDDCGISKTALVVFRRNEQGNRFWEKMGFSAREDLYYRDRVLIDMERIDT